MIESIFKYIYGLKAAQIEPTEGVGSILDAQQKIHLLFCLKIIKSVLRSAGLEG